MEDQPEIPLPKPLDRNVTIRLEEEQVNRFEAEEGGGGPPELPRSTGGLRKVDSVCWPCVLMGVGALLMAVAYVWWELSSPKRG